MRLFEYESKRLLSEAGIGIPRGLLIASPQEVEKAARAIPPPAVLKAQVLTGGRYKAGGVAFVQDVLEAKAQADRLFGTAIRGYRATQLLWEEAIEAEQKLFLAVTYDPAAKQALVLLSKEGGVEIESLALAEPERIVRYPFDPRNGFLEYQGREATSALGVQGQDLLQVGGIVHKLVQLFFRLDATLVEVNPLAKTPQGQYLALDAHIALDDDALYRHPELEERYHIPKRETIGREATDFERRAAQIDAMDHRGVAGRVIEFDGDLGLLIGGGGASLTVFDAIRQYGGRPANYCEIGGNPSVRKVAELTKLILSKPGVKKLALIMNVVSNTRVDLVARGVVKGVIEAGRDPAEAIAIFRVPGSWEEEGVRILKTYSVPYCDRAVSLDEAARMAVARSQ